MPVNLLNEKALNQYLTNLVFKGQSAATVAGDFSRQKLSDIPFIEENMDFIVNYMVLQYAKHRIRTFLVDNSDVPFLVPVDASYPNLPDWAKQAISNNNKVFEFKEELIAPHLQDELITICNFLQVYTENHIKRHIAIAQKFNMRIKIRIDHLKTSNRFSDIKSVLEMVGKHRHVLADRVEAHKKELEEQLKLQQGIEFITNLTNNYKVVRLLTPEALDAEATHMRHCIGDGTFDERITDKETVIYSIRDSENKPHVTLEINNNKICQCTGKNNKRPIPKYIPYVLELLEKLNLNLTIKTAKIGIIRNEGVYYNLFDLPNEFVIKGDLDISEMELSKLPNLSHVIILGNFTCAGNQLHDLTGSPREVHGFFDCSRNQITNLEGCTRHIGKSFLCQHNQLLSLIGGPTTVLKDYDCSNNCLQTLSGAPEHIYRNFICIGNQIPNLNGGPSFVEQTINCSYNPINDLTGTPQQAFELICRGSNLSTSSNIDPHTFAYPIKGVYTHIIEDIKKRISTPQLIQPHANTFKTNPSQHTREN